jgi:hypothetical protein
MISRWLSGTGLWRLQNRIRAVGQLVYYYNDAQKAAIEKQLKMADSSVRMFDEITKLEKAQKKLLGVEGDINEVKEYGAYLREYQAAGLKGEAAEQAAKTKALKQYEAVLGRLKTTEGKRIKQLKRQIKMEADSTKAEEYRNFVMKKKKLRTDDEIKNLKKLKVYRQESKKFRQQLAKLEKQEDVGGISKQRQTVLVK